MEGQILGNRYELLEKIGGGGMAFVYKAKCTLLNRFVAIKILRPEFINDEEFVKRFRIEAQAAASLSHPNVVSVYDVGQENNIHYIVMEYIDGITLKDYIVKKAVLGWEEAIKITIQICSAVEHAHRNHIVHRDIKPHNILLTRQGIAKVTDFGIARAASSTTITMVGSTIGSVHYFSPEQARGGFTDEKSDLYSLGIALYEMVTGKVPFDGDTPVAVALKHLQNEPVEPAEVNDGVPRGVNDIILKAIKKDLTQRYQTASDMLKDLYNALKDPDGDFVEFESQDNFSATKRYDAITHESLPERKNGSQIKTKENDKNKSGKKNDKLTYWLAGITSVILLAIVGYIVFNVIYPVIFGDSKQIYVLEDYTNRNINDVKEELAKNGITVLENRKHDDNLEKDMIISQDKTKGTEFKIGGYNLVNFVVSDGPNLVKIPYLKNKDYRDADTRLSEDMKLTTRIEKEYSEDVGEGLVIRTIPDAEEQVKAGSEVIIYVSKGVEKKPVKIPDLIGKTKAEAENLIAKAKLKIGNVTPGDSSNSSSRVFRQSPLPGTSGFEGDAVNIDYEAPPTPTPSPTSEPESEPQKEVTPVEKKIMSYKYSLVLDDVNKYGDKVKVRVEVTPSDTNIMQVLIDEEKNKTDFPLPVLIPIPEGGKTHIVIYYDNALYLERDQSYEGQ